MRARIRAECAARKSQGQLEYSRMAGTHGFGFGTVHQTGELVDVRLVSNILVETAARPA